MVLAVVTFKYFEMTYEWGKLDPTTRAVTLTAFGFGIFGAIALIVALLQFFGSL